MIYYTHQYLLNPVHRITIDLVGLGGTGSQVLTHLARMNSALLGLGHPGLYVRAWDNDIVASSNMGRQMFSESDLNINKATVLISRINRFFGTDWQAMPTKYTGQLTSNILVTCVDSAKARINIGKKISWANKEEPVDNLYYWLDLGNLQKTGQCILGSKRRNYYNPNKAESSKQVLKTVIEQFPQLSRIKEKDLGPSCSLAEALEKQDLFINTAISQFGCNLLWKLFRDGQLRIHGAFINLENFIVNPIKIK